MAINLSHLLVIGIVLLVIQPLVQSRSIQESFKSLQDLKESQKGQTVKGLNEIKSYLNRFGYLNYNQTADMMKIEDEEFDQTLEDAVKTYQKNFCLNVTGKLDSNTVELMKKPRCGAPDKNIGLQYAYFNGNQKWNHSQLTYSFDSSVTGDTLTLLRAACSQAFSEWQKVLTDFTFNEITGEADIKVGYYRGAHVGDSIPFDGPFGSLAHTKPLPETEVLVHFDADEQWSNTPNLTQFDTVGVALHELGHALGLAHSSNPNAVMYPAIDIGLLTVKRVPQPDDVQGIKALYAF